MTETTTPDFPSLVDFQSAEDQRRAELRREWSDFNDALRKRDGRKTFTIGRRLGLGRDEMLASLRLSELTAKLKAEADSLEAKTAEIEARAAKAAEIVAQARKCMLKCEAEKARIFADLPGELAALRKAAEAGVALCDRLGQDRAMFLRSRGWVPYLDQWARPGQGNAVMVTVPQHAAMIEVCSCEILGFAPAFRAEWYAASGLAQLDAPWRPPAPKAEPKPEPAAESPAAGLSVSQYAEKHVSKEPPVAHAVCGPERSALLGT